MEQHFAPSVILGFSRRLYSATLVSQVHKHAAKSPGNDVQLQLEPNCTAVPKKQNWSSSQSAPAAAPLGKTNAWQTLLEHSDPAISSAPWIRKVRATSHAFTSAHQCERKPHLPCTHHLLFIRILLQQEQYSQHAGNKRQLNIPNKLETTKPPKTTTKIHRDV